MPADERTHFEIPEQATHEDRVHSQGRSVLYLRSDFRAHGEALLVASRTTRAALSRTRDYDAIGDMFAQISAPAGRRIAAERSKLAAEGVEIISLLPEPNRALVRIPKARMQALESRIERYATEWRHPNRATFSVIETIEPVSAESKLDDSLPPDLHMPTPCILHLYARLSEREQASVARSVTEFVASLGHVAALRHLSTGTTLVETVLSRPEMLATGREFSTIRYIAPNRTFYLTDGVPLGRIPGDVKVEQPTTDIAVAVVDSGIAPSSPYIGHALATTIRALPPGATVPEYNHGTFVASRILYGEGLDGQLALGRLTPACRLVDIPVFGLTPSGADVYPTEAQLAQAVDSALQKLPKGVRVINASVGTDEPIQDGKFSVVASVLDHHARERDLVVVVSAGNIRDPRLVRNYRAEIPRPHWRLDAPGEALLALTVGSIAHYEDKGVLAQHRWLSPFSRRGPGADGGLKPELVAHGGNCYAVDPLYTRRIAALGLHGDGVQVACDVGTSFAAPLVSRDAAIVCGHYLSPSANLVRALLCHFAEPAFAPAVGVTQHELVGLGEPMVERCIMPRPHAAAFLHSGHIRADVFRYVPFYVPEALASGAGKGHLRIRVTVALDPPVNPQNLPAYAQCRMTLGLRKPQEVGHRDLAVTGESVDTARWSPLLSFEKRFQRRYRAGAWELRLRAWTRDLPEHHVQGYAAVIEVIDDSQTVDVWSEVAKHAGAAFKPATVRGAAA